MHRRNFFKLVGTASGGALSGACGKQAEEIIPLLVPEEEIVPGVEAWRPSICSECGAGCRTLARVMAAEREIDQDGQRVRQRIAAVKKLEGNPSDPVSGGRLCARGHASLQSIYNPDRIRGPLKRVGAPGSGEFAPLSWDAALEEVSRALASNLAADPSKILFLAQPTAGSRASNIARFLGALGAPPASGIGLGDFSAELAAARRAFGWDGIPVCEIQDATLVLSIGADFLGTWASPVLYSRRYGHMRQGRRELRGRLVHAESRFSTTAWNADQWLPVLPNGELALALGVGSLLIRDHLGQAPDGVPRSVVSLFSEVDLDRAASGSGISVAVMRAVAGDLATASAPVVVSGSSIVRPNSADAVTAACAINILLRNIGKPGGILPPADSGTGLEDDRPGLRGWSDRLATAELVFVDRANPVYSHPHFAEHVARAETVVSFSPFLDDTSAYADIILPDHSALEREGVVVPDISPVPSVAAAAAFVAPLYDTRSTDEVLAALAEAAGRPFDVLGAEGVLSALHGEAGGSEADASTFVADCLERGGWSGRRGSSDASISPNIGEFAQLSNPEGLLFQAYPSLQFGEGSGANRPWLQELPDPTSSAMWGAPVELDPATASNLGVTNGDSVRVESAHGALEAPAYVNPAAIPGVASMALGQGHSNYGRYASGRGANPMSVVGDIRDPATGASALGPVSVSIRKVGGTGRLVQFSRQDRDAPPHRV